LYFQRRWEKWKNIQYLVEILTLYGLRSIPFITWPSPHPRLLKEILPSPIEVCFVVNQPQSPPFFPKPLHKAMLSVKKEMFCLRQLFGSKNCVPQGYDEVFFQKGKSKKSKTKERYPKLLDQPRPGATVGVAGFIYRFPWVRARLLLS
jgi:hypothetical protein